MTYNLSNEKDFDKIDNKYYINNTRIKSRDYITYICPICNRKQKSIAYTFKNIICGNCQTRQTKLNKYNDENYNNTNKTKQTKLDKYGNENYNNIDKTKQTNLIKYDNASSLHGINQSKTDDIFIEKYGSKCSLTNKKIREKSKKTLYENYGITSTFQLVSSKNTMQKKYGCINPAQNPEIHKKIMSSFSRRIKLKKINENLHYQTKPELEFINYCLSENINVYDGPTIPYFFNNNWHIYYVDFETDKYIIEIKASHFWFKKDLYTGKIEAKNKAAKEYALSVNKEFLFLLDIENYNDPSIYSI